MRRFALMRAGVLAAALAFAASALRAETFRIDPNHTSVSFRVAHMVVSRVTGQFDRFAGTVTYDRGRPAAWAAETVIDAGSINTRVAARDNHLRSAEFLDVERYPKITFKSTKASAVEGNRFKLAGALTIHGVTKPVVLDVEIGGVVKDPRGETRLGASATTKISRRDFGLTWNRLLESGGALVGDEIEISLDIEAVAKNRKS